MPSHRHVNNML